MNILDDRISRAREVTQNFDTRDSEVLWHEMLKMLETIEKITNFAPCVHGDTVVGAVAMLQHDFEVSETEGASMKSTIATLHRAIMIARDPSTW